MIRQATPKHEFVEIRCAGNGKNGRPCALYLGDVEISRPNISRKRCHLCGIVWQISVDADRVVNQEISPVRQITSRTIPVVILHSGPTKSARVVANG